ncbi:MAG: DUF4124 domain-containing protein [Proteobacteria bacterium]|nr:DUF4124 domain-containing protein [Pseudomonadota bacterium]
MNKLIISAVLIMLWVYPVFAEENVYSWKDKKGVSHFSNQLPPDDIEKYDTVKSKLDYTTTNEPTEESRPEYDTMVENAEYKIKQNELEVKQQETERSVKEEQQADENRKAQKEAKRKELRDKIDALNKRPLSRSFNKAFRQGQINIIQKQIDELNKSK